MAILDKLRVLISPYHGWRVAWKLRGAENDWTVKVFRSTGEEGPWEEIGHVNAVSNVVFFDRDMPWRGLFDRLFYKLEFYDGSNDIQIKTKAVTLGNHADRQSNEIIRQHELLLYGVNSHPGYYAVPFACFKRIKNGTPCSYCRNQSGQRVVSRCTVCKGTGTIEAYTNPILFRARFISGGAKRTTVGELGESENLMQTLFLTDYPELEPGDILAEKDNGDRWRVESIETSEPGGVIVSQRAAVSLIIRDDIANELCYPGDFEDE